MPRVLVAFDSFKGSMSASAACAVAAEAFVARDGMETESMPMADGGEGSGEALATRLGLEPRACRVHGPLAAMRLDADLLLAAGDGGKRRLAVVEMARASGLTLLPPARYDPLRATTRGTGELLLRARELGAERIWLAVGGSATVDGGCGAARACGWRFLDRRGAELAEGGGALVDLQTIEPAESFPTPIEVLCDVDHPLCGPQGAARVFAPQKGATPEMVERLDLGLRRLATKIDQQLGIAVDDMAGGGAAGGLAAGACAFLGATLASGASRIAEIVGLEESLRRCDWVLTGEGAVDATSLRGKVVGEVVRRARRLGKSVALVAGRSALPADVLRAAGIARWQLLEEVAGSAEAAIAAPEKALRSAVDRLRLG